MKFMQAEIELMVHAMNAGTEWANSLKVGDTFMGAMPEAKNRYCTLREQRLFMFSAVSVIERHRLCTDGKGIITEYSPVGGK